MSIKCFYRKRRTRKKWCLDRVGYLGCIWEQLPKWKWEHVTSTRIITVFRSYYYFSLKWIQLFFLNQSKGNVKGEYVDDLLTWEYFLKGFTAKRNEKVQIKKSLMCYRVRCVTELELPIFRQNFNAFLYKYLVFIDSTG